MNNKIQKKYLHILEYVYSIVQMIDKLLFLCHSEYNHDDMRKRLQYSLYIFLGQTGCNVRHHLSGSNVCIVLEKLLKIT